MMAKQNSGKWAHLRLVKLSKLLSFLAHVIHRILQIQPQTLSRISRRCSQDYQSELLHDRMRLLEFSINQVDGNLYDIRLKMAIGGDINEPEYDIEVFEFIEHPCTPDAADPEVPRPLTKEDCINGVR